MAVEAKILSPKIPRQLDEIKISDSHKEERHVSTGIVTNSEISGESIDKMCFEKIFFQNTFCQ